MRDHYRDYWIECVAQSLEEHGVAASKEQVEAVAKDMQLGHEMHGEAFGHHNIPNPMVAQIESLKREVLSEREKILCNECTGSGRLVSYGPYHSFESTCWKCRGEGRHSP